MPVETKNIMKTIKNINDTSKLKETLITKEFKDSKDINLSDHMNSKTELLLNSSDIFANEQAKLIDNKKLTVKIRKVDIPNSTSVFPVK